jgi:hypothetical protein
MPGDPFATGYIGTINADGAAAARYAEQEARWLGQLAPAQPTPEKPRRITRVVRSGPEPEPKLKPEQPQRGQPTRRRTSLELGKPGPVRYTRAELEAMEATLSIMRRAVRF